MKRFTYLVFCLSLILIFPKLVTANELRIDSNDVQSVSIRSLTASPLIEGESFERKHISYVIQFLNSLYPIHDKSDFKEATGLAQELIIQYNNGEANEVWIGYT